MMQSTNWKIRSATHPGILAPSADMRITRREPEPAGASRMSTASEAFAPK